MSKISVSGNASGTGTVTIAAPATSVNRTLTLPDNSGELISSVSDITAQVKTSTNAAGAAPVYACRAWVNFDGTRDTTGAVSTANTARLIRASGNVTSVVRTGTGAYTVTFTTPMSDAFYAITSGGSQTGTTASNDRFTSSYAVSTTQCQVIFSAWTNVNSPIDPVVCSIAVFC